MSNYDTLLQILDQIRREAPPEFARYHPDENDFEKINQARSRAYVHLYLKVKFGILDFREREKWVSDGGYDGGIDGYYIDYESKAIYCIQSKFRTTENNYHEKEITLQEILKMDTERIIETGETMDEAGNDYNGKIQGFIRGIQEIRDIARYKYKIIVLANLRGVTEPQLQKLVGRYSIEIVNNDKCYKELVFPVVTGTYFNEPELIVNINFPDSHSPRIEYAVDTEFATCGITIVFAPTVEIAKAMSKYKNSILKYNPRSYLDLVSNKVNREIAETIRSRTSNEFALFNNGITIISEKTDFSSSVGIANSAQLILTNPQIINGGQTAYTLSYLYEAEKNRGENPEIIFQEKEVLLKIITFPQDAAVDGDTTNKLRLLDAVSRATNRQTEVKDADRRSNDSQQIEIQEYVFDEFGRFYERKRGEYHDGITLGYVDRTKVINRESFLRVCAACSTMPAEARRGGNGIQKDSYYRMLYDLNSIRRYYFGYLCYERIENEQRTYARDVNNRYGYLNFGNALRYGEMAVVTMACHKYSDEIEKTEFDNKVSEAVTEYLSRWRDFEKHVAELPRNNDYFRRLIDQETGEVTLELNYDNYYKGRTLNRDLIEYFELA